jgi:hypothetical protein
MRPAAYSVPWHSATKIRDLMMLKMDCERYTAQGNLMRQAHAENLTLVVRHPWEPPAVLV